MNRLIATMLTIMLWSLLLGGCSLPFNLDASPTDPLVMTPEEVVESFYNWYMNYPGNVLVERAYQQNIYLTDSFIETVDKTLASFTMGGADIIVCAQDIPERLFLQAADIHGDNARMEVKSSFEGHSISIELLKVNNDWKIDRIGCVQ